MKADQGDLCIDADGLWFVVRTLAHRENLAALHLTAQKFKIFLPRFKKTVRHARKSYETITPLFPCYIFVALDLERDRWRSINGTIGVAHLLSAEGRPISVPKGVVETLISRLDEAGLVTFQSGLRLGQWVNVVHGPFAQNLGVLQRLDGNGRARVLLEMMGAAVSVAIDSANLTAA